MRAEFIVSVRPDVDDKGNPERRVEEAGADFAEERDQKELEFEEEGDGNLPFG